MTAVILAAGVSSRLRPLTTTIPKCLLEVGGVPLLRRTLTSLQHEGINDVVIVTGYLHEMIEQFVGPSCPGQHVVLVHNQNYETTNNNYSLWLSKPHVLGRDLVVLDADILFDRRILSALLGASSGDALVVRHTDTLSAEEVKVQCDARGRVLRIGKDVDRRAAVGESLGIEKFSGSTTKLLFSALERRKDFDEFYEASFQEVIDGGAQIFSVDSDQLPCMEIDTLEDLRAAELLARVLPV